MCHHTCWVILPADPNCLPKGCMSLAASHHQDMVFLSLELCWQNMERREQPVRVMKHLCATAQDHTATLCQPWVCWLHTVPVFPRSTRGHPGTPELHMDRTPGPAGVPTSHSPNGGGSSTRWLRPKPWMQEGAASQSVFLLWTMVPTALPALCAKSADSGCLIQPP